ncbi:hypothetical protein M569_03349 [Genlisea aurea]|uniref:DUF868 domain-containing protein n=1 Tax=Genlisea aurea TaxID=192259 RepID=S8E6F6_9LAMI|nr:hypothetical protein M569_03349 [Genlisea aurea]
MQRLLGPQLGIMNLIHDQIGIMPSCFSSPPEKRASADDHAISRSGQSVYMSVYRTKLAGQCRFITVTWCRNLLLHGLSVAVQGCDGASPQYACKIELNPLYFWKKQGSKRFSVEGKSVFVFWDLKIARFSGEAEPESEYYVAVVSDGEVALLLGNLRKEAYRKTGCRPSLIDPILVSRKEHIFGKKRFVTRVKFHERGSFNEIVILIENTNRSSEGQEMEIQINGIRAIHVGHLEWKFRGNQSIDLNKSRIDVYWDVHDWLFNPGLRHGLFIFKPKSQKIIDSDNDTDIEFCLFIYAWKLE